MFEEVCLVCGKHLPDAGRAYCSDDCLSVDISSPCLSSSSSALSSPHLGYAHGSDVPPLVPSVLGALRNYRGRDHHSVSSSSTSSTAWSLLTDDESEEGLSTGAASDSGMPDMHDSLYDGGSKSASHIYSFGRSSLSYARRPSGTNNRSTVPHITRCSPSPSKHVQGFPRSVPIRSLASADDVRYSNLDSSRGAPDADESELLSEKEWSAAHTKSGTARAKTGHARASLPAYFSLLQMSPADTRSSPVSSSSGHTVARASPPTPRTGLTGPSLSGTALTVVTTSSPGTPRGRLREPIHTDTEDSYSTTLRDIIPTRAHPSLFDPPGSVKWGGAKAFAWSSRGRPTVRRNSSPAPKKFLEWDEPLKSPSYFQKPRLFENALSSSPSPDRKRGRIRSEELDGPSLQVEAPDLVQGRSGLLARQRASEQSKRVPL